MMKINNSKRFYADSERLESLEHRYRAHLINSLSGFKSANLVGTVSPSGVFNLAMVSSVFHLGAHPPLMGFISRPNSVRRDSIENLRATGFFTLNHVSRDIYRQAHQTSARYAAEVSEFTEVGLTPVAGHHVKAPYVEEALIKIGLQVEEIKPIEVNGTDLVIGRIIEISLPQASIAEDGYVDIEKAGTVAVSGLDSYHQTQQVDRLSYAKPDRPLNSLLHGEE